MNHYLTLLLCATIIGASYSATLMANPQCMVCKTGMDWVRSNENVLMELKNDEQVSQEFLDVLDSDLSSESVCGLLAMCETKNEASDYLVNLKGGKGGKKGKGGHQTHLHGHVHIGGGCNGDNC